MKYKNEDVVVTDGETYYFWQIKDKLEQYGHLRLANKEDRKEFMDEYYYGLQEDRDNVDDVQNLL